MTSSPAPMFSAMRQANRASLPDETPIACEQFEYAATAFSHCSTFGPKMKCWDSNTSATAPSTSALMVAYCALRSSNGTFILGLLLQLSVRFRTDTQFGWQLRFLVKVEASQD